MSSHRLSKIIDNQQAIVDGASVKYRHNVTFSEAYRVYNRASGKCEICGAERTAKRNLCLDHCHDTGKARGVLCVKCNAALGMLDSNIDTLHKAIKYLQDNS